MAMIHVNRGTTNLGVFSENEVREGLSARRFAPTDIGWREGMASWQPLSHFPEFAGAGASAVPPVQDGGIPMPTPASARPAFRGNIDRSVVFLMHSSRRCR